MSITSNDLLTPNSYIDEVSEWVEKIYEITEEDYVHGGEHGFSNVPHEQLSNRTLYLKNNLDDLSQFVENLNQNFNSHVSSNLSDFSSLRASVANLSTSLRELSGSLDESKTDTREKIDDILSRIYDLQGSFNNMEYKYAASDRESGDALSVATQKVFATELSLVGVDSAATNKLKYNTSVTVDQSTVKATTFQGNLDGEAKSAQKFSNKVNMTLFGDVVGTVKFDGSDDIKISTSINPNVEGGVPFGTYGPGADLVVKPGEIFYVPEFTVAKNGLVTRIANREITLDLDPDIVNKTINNDPTDDKILLIGTPNQGTRQRTYSNAAVFERGGKLYSNFSEVVDVETEQEMHNKTVNGFYISAAAGRNVDTTIGGTKNSDALITSDAVARHTHNYAPAINGAAEKVYINDNTNKSGFIVTNSEVNKVGIDRNITVSNGKITANSIQAKNEMQIPGGKIWIEQVEGQGVLGLTPDIEALLTEINDLKRKLSNLETDTVHRAKMYENQTCHEMQILSYNSGSYRLADNRNEVLSQNLVLALNSPDSEGMIDVLTYGTYILSTDEYDGCGVYVGQDGNPIFERPYDEDLVIKKVGYVDRNKFVFRPEDSNIDYVVSISNKTWNYDVLGNVMPTTKARAHDAIWEKDVYGDFMPCEGNFSNEYWETVDDCLIPVGEGYVEDNTTWNVDRRGNVFPQAEDFIIDSVWEVDPDFNLAPREIDGTNEMWENIDTEVKLIPLEVEAEETPAWDLDRSGNIVPTEDDVEDEVWELDEGNNLIPRTTDNSNEFWESIEDDVKPARFGEAARAWSLDRSGNITPELDNDIEDEVWELDSGNNIIPRTTDGENDLWESVQDDVKPTSSE